MILCSLFNTWIIWLTNYFHMAVWSIWARKMNREWGVICFGKLGNYRYSQFREIFNKYIWFLTGLRGLSWPPISERSKLGSNISNKSLTMPGYPWDSIPSLSALHLHSCLGCLSLSLSANNLLKHLFNQKSKPKFVLVCPFFPNWFTRGAIISLDSVTWGVIMNVGREI